MSEDSKSLIQNLTQSGQDYVQLKLDYYKIQGIEKGSSVAAVSISSIILGVFGFLAYVWSMVALMFYLSEEVFSNSNFKAAFAIFLGHMLIFVLLFLFKKSIERSITDKIALKGLRKLDSIGKPKK